MSCAQKLTHPQISELEESFEILNALNHRYLTKAIMDLEKAQAEKEKEARALNESKIYSGINRWFR